MSLRIFLRIISHNIIELYGGKSIVLQAKMGLADVYICRAHFILSLTIVLLISISDEPFHGYSQCFGQNP